MIIVENGKLVKREIKGEGDRQDVRAQGSAAAMASCGDTCSEREVNCIIECLNLSTERHPAAMDYHHDVIGMLDPRWKKEFVEFVKVVDSYLYKIRNAHKQGKKIGLCNFNSPTEMMIAMDVVPTVSEILSSLNAIIWSGGAEHGIDYCNEIGLPETMCSAQRAGLGEVFSDRAIAPDFVTSIAPGNCDTNAKIVEFLSEYLHLPYHTVDDPPYQDEDGYDYIHQEYRRLISFMETQTGHKLDPDRLLKVCKESKKCDEYIVGIRELKRAIPNPVPNISVMCECGSKFMAGGTPECTKAIKTIYEQAKERYKRGEGGGGWAEEKVRCYFGYIDYYLPHFASWIELQNEGISCLGNLLLWYGNDDYTIDLSHVDSMIDSLADQALNFPMTRQLNGPYDAKASLMEDLVRDCKDLKADCIIFSGHPACKNAWGCVNVVEKAVTEELGLPWLTVEADCFDERVLPWSAINDKIMEFVNTVVL